MITLRIRPKFCCSPFPWDAALQAGGSLVGNVVGGVLGANAQKEANKTNLQIANMNNRTSMEMFNRQLQFNTFENQRKMLEDAGYSPYSLFGTSSLTAPNAPSLQQAQVIPEDAMATSVGNTMGNLANVVATLAQARKTDEERKGKEIENNVLGDLLGASLKGLLNQNEWQSIQNHIADVTKQDTVDIVGLNKLALENGLQLQTNEIVRGMINNAFLQKYGDQEHTWGIAKMQADAYKAWYEGKYYGKAWEQLPENLQIALRQIKNQEEQTKNQRYAYETERYNANTNRYNAVTNRLDVQNKGVTLDKQAHYYDELAYGESLLNQYKHDNYDRYYSLGLDKIEAEIGNLMSSSEVNYKKIGEIRAEIRKKKAETQNAKDDHAYRLLNEIEKGFELYLKQVGTAGSLFKFGIGK